MQLHINIGDILKPLNPKNVDALYLIIGKEVFDKDRYLYKYFILHYKNIIGDIIIGDVGSIGEFLYFDDDQHWIKIK